MRDQREIDWGPESFVWPRKNRDVTYFAARWPGLPVPFPALVHVPLPLGERQIKILLPVTLQMRLLVGGQRRKEEKKGISVMRLSPTHESSEDRTEEQDIEAEEQERKKKNEVIPHLQPPSWQKKTRLLDMRTRASPLAECSAQAPLTHPRIRNPVMIYAPTTGLQTRIEWEKKHSAHALPCSMASLPTVDRLPRTSSKSPRPGCEGLERVAARDAA